MAEVLLEYTHYTTGSDGIRYLARAWGAPFLGDLWEGWIEFIDPVTGRSCRTGRETTQPNRGDTVYWATGLTPVYLEGALERALAGETQARTRGNPEPVIDETAPASADSVLNPFSVYRKGEVLLRQQLAAMSAWHLVNIVRAYELSTLSSSALNALPAAALIELIVDGVKSRSAELVASSVAYTPQRGRELR